jgi:ubiquinone/menaquinone biosynthesis C-methylase UbiE
MKRKLYTKTYNADLLKRLGNENTIFSAEDHSYASAEQFGDHLQSKETLLRWYLSQNTDKLAALGLLINHMYNKGFLNVLSLGAGPCVLEYLLKCSLPINANVVALDYSLFFIKKAQKFFPKIKAIEFDFFKDDILDLYKKLGIKFDIAVFFGSAYVMNDSQFVNLFRKLKKIGVTQIIDVHSGYMNWKAMLGQLLEPFRKNTVIRRWLRRPSLGNYIGKFHGYSRSRGELRRLYKEAGVSLLEETSVGAYNYVAILANR